MDDDDILKKINSAKTDFYNDNQKNLFFKNKQKFDCAASIMTSFNEDEVFKNAFSVTDNIIIFNYPIFKLIANPEYYFKMAIYIFKITENILSVHSNYDIHLICTGVTISAIERYKEFVKVVSQTGLANGKNFLKSLNKISIINSPSFVDYGLKIIIPIVDLSLWNKIILVPHNKTISI
jgi:hypothetical protein